MRIPTIIPCLLFAHCLCSIFLKVHLVSGSGQGSEDQKALLLKLKASLTFDSSISAKLVTWDPSIDCCSWRGISCKNGRVSELDLSSEGISDGINSSSSLFELQHLKRLNLGFNRLNSVEIPSRIGEFVNLTHLNLGDAGFSGQIPFGIAGLTRLVNLDISNQYFFGIKPLKLENPNLRMLVRNLSSLQELHLDGVNISTGGGNWCNAISSSLPKLRVLSLSNCNLRGPIDSSLAKLQFLADVHLDNNNLSTEVPTFFANFTNLTVLSFSSSELQGRFPEKIFQVLSLKAIDLTNNELLQGTLPELPQNSSLERLVLSNTNFSGNLPYSIGNLKFLSWIELLFCSFSGFLPSSISNLTKLVYVDMSSNSFTGQIPSLSDAKNLSHLYLGHNLFSGSITSTFWNGLSQLSVLDLRNNSFSGTIPSSLFTTLSLQKLQLSNNQFSVLSAVEFQAVSSSSLNTLDLSGNNLSGSLWKYIFLFRNLKILSLSSNNLSGNVELNAIDQLKNLSSLDLSYSGLSVDDRDTYASQSSFPLLTTLKLASCNLRKFPDFLRNQSKLAYLDLSVNHIPGEIPTWIWDNMDLLYLNLSYNSLVDVNSQHDSFSLIGTLDLHSNSLEGALVLPSYAVYLDFSMNNFSSNIPYNIGDNLTFCYFFSLSSNNFYGSIPESLCGATNLQVLDLSNNSLSGNIPGCLNAFSETLGVMNLQMNNLSNTISDTFLKNCSLKTLDLNGNHLNGSVPPSLANCKDLEVLNLGNNQITGTFPYALVNISSLRVLVLRSNKFHGEMDCYGTEKSWPRLQIIDLASNSFSGVLHPKCFLKWQAMVADSDQTDSRLNQIRFEVLKFSQLYYQDSVRVTIKGMEMQLVKILNVFTSIDFSNNQFQGSIPDTIGNFTSLFVLNFSHNAFSGGIPKSLGKLAQLESLDLSYNKLTGKIPARLVALNFLSVLNLSYNQLEGRIPTGSQFDTFSSDSYIGNRALRGPPLKVNWSGFSSLTSPSAKQQVTEEGSANCLLIGAEIGFTLGLGVVIGSLLFWKRWRQWYLTQVDHVLLKILYHQKQRRPSQLGRIGRN